MTMGITLLWIGIGAVGAIPLGKLVSYIINACFQTALEQSLKAAEKVLATQI